MKHSLLMRVEKVPDFNKKKNYCGHLINIFVTNKFRDHFGSKNCTKTGFVQINVGTYFSLNLSHFTLDLITLTLFGVIEIEIVLIKYGFGLG